jgi:hypothetical protein
MVSENQVAGYLCVTCGLPYSADSIDKRVDDRLREGSDGFDCRMGFMDIDEALNDPGLRATRHKGNEWVVDEQTAAFNLLPTTMIGTRPTVTLTFSPRNREKAETEYIAGLGFWARQFYCGFLRQHAD